MITRRYRLFGHAVGAVLIAGAAVVATGAGASATAKPDSYGGDATAASMEIRVDKQPFGFPVEDPFHDWVPYAETSLDSSGGDEAIASAIYPGQGVLGVPALLCEFNATFCDAVVSKLPPYPEYAHAQYPAHPDDSATFSQQPFPGTGPFEVSPHHVVAHADPNNVEATSVTGSSGVTGVVTSDSASSHSQQKFEGSALVVTAESVLRGVDIGGQLHIDEIRSTATATIDGTHPSHASALTTMSGATVAGQAVAIDSNGIHLAGQGDNGAVKQAVNSALKALSNQGIKVTSLGDSKSVRVRKAVAETGGLLVIAKQSVNVPSLPTVGQTEDGDYTITATLGGAGVNAFASPGVPLGDVSVPSAPPTATGGNPPPPASTGGSVPPSTQTGTATSPAGQPAVVAGAPPKTAALPLDLTNKRLETLMLVLLAYPLVMLLSGVLRAPPRLPRLR